MSIFILISTYLAFQFSFNLRLHDKRGIFQCIFSQPFVWHTFLLFLFFNISYQKVRRQLRQDMGYTDEDAITTAANSTTTNNNSNSSSSSQGTLPAVLGDGRLVGAHGRMGGLQQEGHVTSYSHSDSGAGRVKGQKVQSPDVASSK